MKNIFKFLLVSFLIPLFFTSCDDDSYNDWTTPEASFKLYDTSLGGNVLYPTMEENPFILTWDNATASSGTYSVVLSTTELFETKIELGTSETNTLKTTIGALNTALLQAGYSPYQAQLVYIRVETNSGNTVSNSINFPVTPYPVDVPVITSPASGSAFVLDSNTPSATVTTITWSDYATYGVDVVYTVDAAKKGTTDFKQLGTVTNDKVLEITHNQLNQIAIDAGVNPDTEGELDVQVTASTTSTGGNITKTSATITIKVTPFLPEYPTFYLVGDASVVGWNAGSSLLINKNEQISKVYTYLENGKSFRFLGQQAWDPLNYSIDEEGINPAYRYFKTVSSNIVKDGDENMKFTGATGIYKLEINADLATKSLEATASPIPGWSFGAVYIVGSINGWDAGNAFQMTNLGDGKYEYTTNIPDGAEFKFLGQKSWGDLDWGNISGGGNSGYLGPKGDNGNISFNGGGNSHKISIDLKKGTYTIE